MSKLTHVNEFQGMKIGDKLHMNGQYITVGGRITCNDNDEVTIKSIEIRKGYWSNFFDQWNDPKLFGIYLIEHSGMWLPKAFKELIDNPNK